MASASTCIVTGAAGFIGSHLSRALMAAGHRVVGIDNFDPFYEESLKRDNIAGLDSDMFTLIEADIRDATMGEIFCREKPEAVFHIAALAGVRPSIAAADRYLSVNLEGLRNILEAARESECRRIVFASSSSVYGNTSQVPFTEDDRADSPISPYAATKRAGEMICHTWSHLYGQTIAMMRLFTVYGPAQRPDLAISKFMRLIALGETVPMFGDGTNSRDYTFVDDIVSGLMSALDWTRTQPAPISRAFNLGSHFPVPLSELIQSISEVVGRPAQIEQLPLPPGDVDQTYADLTRSKAELGYDPQTPFREGLERQWAWLQPRLEVRS